jgi:hypothetical protein
LRLRGGRLMMRRLIWPKRQASSLAAIISICRPAMKRAWGLSS